MLLSIIIPFFNTYEKSVILRQNIIETLTNNCNIEFILVNDGSIDSTLNNLINYFKIFRGSNNLKIIDQDNRGPGGARNSGLKEAKGKYIWFVDSDDNINIPIVYKRLIQAIESGLSFDFIDFNIKENSKVISSMGSIEPGYHTFFRNKYLNLGRIVTKVICKEVFLNNNIIYPEKHLYEDNYLIYILPDFLNSFFKFEDVVYEYIANPSSITRQEFNRKYYDRLLTSYRGLVDHYHQNNKKIEAGVCERFNEIFYENTLLYLISGILKKNINKSELIEIKKILEWYNFLRRLYDIPLLNSERRGIKAKVLFKFINTLLFFVEGKDWYIYFSNLNKEEWKIK